jgi:hypothetical protein
MSPLPSNWYFGSLARPDSVRNPFGGFDLGDVQSMLRPNDSMTNPTPAGTPSAGVSGSVPGQPPTPSPTGGMDALRPPFDQPAPTGATEGTEAGSNANVTGFNGPLAMAGLNALGTVPGVPGFGSLFAGLWAGALTSLLGGAGARMAATTGANSLPSDMTTSQDIPATPESSAIPSGAPVTYSGNFMGLPTGYLVAQVPGPRATSDPRSIVSQDLSVQVPSVSPNVGPYGGIGGTATAGGVIPSTFSPAPGQTNAPGIFTDPTEPDPGTPTGVNGPAAPATPSDANEGVGVAGVGSAGGGAAGAASAPGDAGGGVSGAYRKGGRVQAAQRRRPDPRMLAAKLQRGARVDVGNPRATTDNVKRVDLQTGEEVMNRPAARAHAAQLEAWNRTGRRAMARVGWQSALLGINAARRARRAGLARDRHSIQRQPVGSGTSGGV